MASDGETMERAHDAAFERLLLDSARADAPADGAAQEAWSRFAAVAGGAAVGAGAGGTDGVMSSSALARAIRRAGLRWFAIGAVSGSALTAAWIGAARSSSTESAQLAPTASAPSVTSTTSAARLSAEIAPDVSPPSVLPSGASARERFPRSPKHPTPAGVALPAKGMPPAERGGSTLAAEIEALDAVRQAIARGAFERARELADAYARDFPVGQLEADVAALAIEALWAQGNRAEARQRARLFLRRYPNDPHRARIAALSEN